MPAMSAAKRGSGSQINSAVSTSKHAGWVNTCFICGRVDHAPTEERIAAIARAHYRLTHWQPFDDQGEKMT